MAHLAVRYSRAMAIAGLRQVSENIEYRGDGKQAVILRRTFA